MVATRKIIMTEKSITSNILPGNMPDDGTKNILPFVSSCESCGAIISEIGFDEFGVCEICMSEGKF